MDKEYIERKTLSDEIKSLQVTVTGLKAGKNVLSEYAKHYKNSVMRIIDEQATADVVEVVRCKDCVNAIKSNQCNPDSRLCNLNYYSDGGRKIVNWDDYCSLGRKCNS